MSKIEIDVIIPVFNGARFIKEAVLSVFQQSLLPRSIIVVDDGSTDETPVILSTLQSLSYPCVLKIIRKVNGGLSSARNAGIQHAEAPYLAFLDADDVWEPHKLEHQAQIFISTCFSRLGVVYCDYSNIDQAGRDLDQYPSFVLNPTVRGNILPKLFEGNFISSSGSGVVVRKECFEKVGVFDESLGASEDWDMWLRIAQDYEFDFSGEKLVKLRRHDHNMSNNVARQFFSDLKMLSKHREKYPLIVSHRIHRAVINAPNFKIFRQLFLQSADASLAQMIQIEYPKLYQKMRAWIQFLLLKVIEKINAVR